MGPLSQSRAVNAKLESNSEPGRARLCQRVAVGARVGVTESHMRETFLAYLNIVLLQND